MTALRGLRLVRDLLLTVVFFGVAAKLDSFSWVDVVLFVVFMLFVWWLDAQTEKQAAMEASAFWSRALKDDTDTPTP